MIYPDSLSTVINTLRSEGYTEDFNLISNHLADNIDDYKIDNVFRFEGMSSQDDESVLYAISSDKLNRKGIVVNGYGISSDAKTDELILKLLR